MQAVSKINFPGWVGVVGLYENKAIKPTQPAQLELVLGLG